MIAGPRRGIMAARPGEGWDAEIGAIEVRFGAGRLAVLGEIARSLGGSRVLVVTDRGVSAAGHVDRAARALLGSGLEADVWDGVAENPTSEQVAAAAGFAAGRSPDLIVGLGGGSALDTAKGVNLLLTNGGRMEDYRGFGRAARPLLPAVGVPTTAGSGSEAQSYAIVADAEGRKMACGDAQARFRAVVLDPELTASAPRRVTAAAGLDALSHAVESLVSRGASPVSRMLSAEAWRLLASAMDALLAGPAGVDDRGRALLGAHLAGAAIEQSMLGAAHACANPLGARVALAHGAAVALMLPHVVRFNAAAMPELYDALSGERPREAVEAGGWLAARLEGWRAAGGLPARLRDCGIAASELPALAREAAQQWTARFNPRPIGEAETLALYRAAW